ncbi:MAG: hypothetical protein HUK22_06520, partial [Thermoguttaceae bacterium]|nr:hypothetical protein [Thermoguttaceae bacterium]
MPTPFFHAAFSGSRRNILTLLALFAAFAPLSNVESAELKTPLDREQIVARHRIQSENLDLLLPIGNGNFCFNIDGTGLQTFAGETLSHWGWFSEPLPEKFSWDQLPPTTGTYYRGRLTGGDDSFTDGEIYGWVRSNPHQMNLARVRFVRADGSALQRSEISAVKRDLNLWNGVCVSMFELDGTPVAVTTCVGSDVKLDSSVAVRVDSELVRRGELAIRVDFPYPSLKREGGWTGDFSDAAPRTDFSVARLDDGALVVKRALFGEYAEGVVGNYSYSVRVDCAGGSASQIAETSAL